MLMIAYLKIIIYLYLHTGVQGSWFPCTFSDERQYKKSDGTLEIEYISRESMLQFGKKGDAPVNPDAITFLVTGSKLNLNKYLKGVEPDQVECGLHRHRTRDDHARWPIKQADEFNVWFSCTIKHTNGDFMLTSFLRYPTEQPPSTQDSDTWPAISDRATITTTAVMMMKTLTPSLKSNLGAQNKLHCQFAIDHKGPNFTLEWHKRGERSTLFSYSRRTGQTEGQGVELKGLADGDASYNLAYTKIANEGAYVCSVSVLPLSASLDISLHVEESPRVALSVGPTLTLEVGEMQKVVCEVDHYYPLDVQIVWYKQEPAALGQTAGSLLPTMVANTLLSSHKHNSDRTYSLSSFFYLSASLSDSGKQFTCKVSHKSLRVDIKKSFILTVEEPSSWFFVFSMLVIIVIFLAVLFKMLPTLHKARRKRAQKKPY
ncbi:tapasin-related protein [Takifugu flavidus]|uniref:tapasin-related protein n=1 Tax=Takifugu flavidus TaxID=433684 RepID=UPI002544C029|nr:tapasin-related protein [Takifugu flavidus]